MREKMMRCYSLCVTHQVSRHWRRVLSSDHIPVVTTDNHSSLFFSQRKIQFSKTRGQRGAGNPTTSRTILAFQAAPPLLFLFLSSSFALTFF